MALDTPALERVNNMPDGADEKMLWLKVQILQKGMYVSTTSLW